MRKKKRHEHSMSRTSRSSLTQHLKDMVARYSALLLGVFNPYRPELHYMRGPGPKCRARQRQMP